MKLCNDTVVFRAVAGMDADGLEVYKDISVSGCSWYKQGAASVNSKGITDGSSIIIRIPAEKAPDGFALSKGMKVSKGGETSHVLAWTDNRRAPNGGHIKVVCG